MIRKLVLVALIPLLVAGCRATQEASLLPLETGTPATSTPRNIILFVGDGMASTHFTVLHHLRGESSTLPRFTSSAMVMTHSDSSLVTDSGAAATAMAAGIKTTNAALSVTPTGEEVKTVLEIAEDRGLMTGLVTTTNFWDATPAAFAAHTLSRRNARLIVDQMLSSGVDLVISNGSEKFGVDDAPSIDELSSRYGYTSITSAAGLVPTAGKVLALFPGNPLELDHPDAPLPVLTAYALEQLSGDPQGFFLMIEHEGTDGASHRNETEHVLESLRSIDQAVAIALDYAETNGDTLLLFTGDHETGALQISPSGDSGEMKLEWFSGHHTGQALPIFAYGPGSSVFTGWIDNTDIGKWLKEMVARR